MVKEQQKKKKKDTAKTMQQNQTDMILLQCFCSIFLLQKLNLLQCLMGWEVQYLISMHSEALFWCVFLDRPKIRYSNNCPRGKLPPPPLVRVRVWFRVSLRTKVRGTIFLWGNCPRTLNYITIIF